MALLYIIPKEMLYFWVTILISELQDVDEINAWIYRIQSRSPIS